MDGCQCDGWGDAGCMCLVIIPSLERNQHRHLPTWQDGISHQGAVALTYIPVEHVHVLDGARRPRTSGSLGSSSSAVLLPSPMAMAGFLLWICDSACVYFSLDLRWRRCVLLVWWRMLQMWMGPDEHANDVSHGKSVAVCETIVGYFSSFALTTF
jgi:hypothetical protein